MFSYVSAKSDAPVLSQKGHKYSELIPTAVCRVMTMIAHYDPDARVGDRHRVSGKGGRICLVSNFASRSRMTLRWEPTWGRPHAAADLSPQRIARHLHPV